jgi:hypothetical protein
MAISHEDLATLDAIMKQVDELVATIEQHAASVENCGLDFAETDDIVITDRAQAMAWFERALAAFDREQQARS